MREKPAEAITPFAPQNELFFGHTNGLKSEGMGRCFVHKTQGIGKGVHEE